MCTEDRYCCADRVGITCAQETDINVLIELVLHVHRRQIYCVVLIELVLHVHRRQYDGGGRPR